MATLNYSSIYIDTREEDELSRGRDAARSKRPSIFEKEDIEIFYLKTWEAFILVTGCAGIIQGQLLTILNNFP